MHAFAEACRRLEKARVRYVIVGAFGINLYAEEAGIVVTTLDCDILLPSEVPTLARAIRALRRLGYEFEAGGEPFIGEHPDDLAGVIRARGCLRARRKEDRLDLPLQIAGFDFRTLWRRHRRFKMGRICVRVAPLKDLLRSKELADRPKDRLFLATYRSALEELLAKPSKKRRGRS